MFDFHYFICIKNNSNPGKELVMKKWEYYTEDTGNSAITPVRLAELGDGGWEMCGCYAIRPTGTSRSYFQVCTYHFKRRL
ncbi:MAG: hypothetical protein ACI9H6_000217 [Patiriisocius sp.]|jgi:hypothetical protein